MSPCKLFSPSNAIPRDARTEASDRRHIFILFSMLHRWSMAQESERDDKVTKRSSIADLDYVSFVASATTSLSRIQAS